MSKDEKAYIPARENINATSDVDGVDTVFGYWGPFSYPMRRRLDLAVKSMRKSGGFNAVLDAGYGCGIFLPDLYRRLAPEGRLYGVDIHGEHSSVYDKLLPGENMDKDRVVLNQESLEKLSFADDSFDLVVSISVLEHIKPESLAPCLSEIDRVAKPDADIIIGFPTDCLPIKLLSLVQGNDLKKNHPSSHRDIFQAIEQAGLKVAEQSGFPLFWGPLTMHFNVRVEHS